MASGGGLDGGVDGVRPGGTWPSPSRSSRRRSRTARSCGSGPGSRAGSKTPSIIRSSCGCAPLGLVLVIVFHSAKCSAGVVMVPTRAFMRSVTPMISTKRYSARDRLLVVRTWLTASCGGLSRPRGFLASISPSGSPLTYRRMSGRRLLSPTMIVSWLTAANSFLRGRRSRRARRARGSLAVGVAVGDRDAGRAAARGRRGGPRSPRATRSSHVVDTDVPQAVAAPG